MFLCRFFLFGVFVGVCLSLWWCYSAGLLVESFDQRQNVGDGSDSGWILVVSIQEHPAC